jgi:hypothetical protein
MRAATGRPHWILVDEAHHLLPRARDTVSTTLPQELPATILVTVHPDAVAPEALALVETILAIGDTAPNVIASICDALGEPCPAWPGQAPDPGQVLYWNRRTAEAHFVSVAKPRQAHRRHTRKYAEGNLGDDKSFYFRGPQGALNLRAQNLTLFLQIAEGVDDATWLHHLRSGDYSAWFHSAIKDDELAQEIAAIERDESLGSLDSSASRARVKEAVSRRYTAPCQSKRLGSGHYPSVGAMDAR